MNELGPNRGRDRDRAGSAEEVDESDIVERIFQAVVEQRLPPGTKLSESALCEAFGVGRMRIRRALLLLASREVVELRSNRGAFVASPTAEQARQVFEARLAIEPSVVQLAVARATPDDVAALRRGCEQEHALHHAGRRHEAIRLSGAFHVDVARLAGNAVLLRTITDLVTRSSLILGLYGGPEMASCRDDEHGDIVDAFAARDGSRAAALMVAHLNDIQANMDLTRTEAADVDLVTLLGPRGTAGTHGHS